MSVICVIPARYNSSRFPGKLLANALGKTVLQRTWESASLCSKFDGLYIATDSEEIAEHAKKIGAEILWTSSTPRDGTERITEALEKYPCLQAAELILNLQGDAPGTPPQTLQAIINMLEQDPSAVMATAASPLTDPEDRYVPQTVKCVCDRQGNALYFSRAPIPYCQAGMSQALVHIGIYCYRSAFLKTLASLPPTPLQMQENLEQLRILEWGYRIKVALVDPNPPSVDTPEDLLELEEFLCQKI